MRKSSTLLVLRCLSRRYLIRTPIRRPAGCERICISCPPSYAPEAFVIVRARYHVHRWQLNVAGANAVVDEEDRVGVSIAAEVRDRLRYRQTQRRRLGEADQYTAVE